MKASIELDCAAAQFADAWNILDPLRDFVPAGIKLVGGGVARRLDSLIARDEGVQLDDFAMALQHVNGELAGNEAGDGGNVGVGSLLAHHDDGSRRRCFGDCYAFYNYILSSDWRREKSFEE